MDWFLDKVARRDVSDLVIKALGMFRKSLVGIVLGTLIGGPALLTSAIATSPDQEVDSAKVEKRKKKRSRNTPSARNTSVRKRNGEIGSMPRR
jgi:hypothetical protein